MKNLTLNVLALVSISCFLVVEGIRRPRDGKKISYDNTRLTQVESERN